MTNSLKKYKWNTNSPDFDFVEGCQTGLVVWWNEWGFCIDKRKLKRWEDFRKPTLTEWIEKEIKEITNTETPDGYDAFHQNLLVRIRGKIKAGEFSGL